MTPRRISVRFDKPMDFPPDTKISELVERAFRDGIAYAEIAEISGVNFAWEQSRVRRDLFALLRKAEQ